MMEGSRKVGWYYDPHTNKQIQAQYHGKWEAHWFEDVDSDTDGLCQITGIYDLTKEVWARLI